MGTENTTYRMPAEWEPHRATWIAWPYQEFDFPGKVEVVRLVYAEVVRHLSQSERVEILCLNDCVEQEARLQLERGGIKGDYTFHRVPNDRSWLRDSFPTAVKDASENTVWISWLFNAWAKYDNYLYDRKLASFVAEQTKRTVVQAKRLDREERLVLEGGAIETDGEGTLLTTEECLLSEVQERNQGLSKEAYEALFKKYLGIQKTIWLGKSCEGDDTHGHIDDVARFVAPGVVVLSYCSDTSDPNHAAAADNLNRLQKASDARGRKLQVIQLPTPTPIYCDGYRLPASYANFYIANKIVLVPTFNDPNDRLVLNTLAELFPTRKIIGIHSGDLILGYGTLHCLSQHEPI
jgi:agmatine deiminase